MSVLTKVLVVLVTILSVLLVAVVVTFTVNQENYRAQFDIEKSKRRVAEQKARIAQNEQQAHLEERDLQLSEMTNRIDDLQVLADGKDANAADVRADNVKFQAQLVTKDAEIASLSSMGEIHSGLVRQMRDELKELLAQLDKSRIAQIRFSDLANARKIQIETLEKEQRRFREVVAALGKENEQLTALMVQHGLSMGKKTDESVVPFASPVRIDGRITAVEKVGGDVYVQVDVGRNDSAEPKMRFLVYFPGEYDGSLVYKGSLVLDWIDVESSSGRMTLIEPDKTIEVGDQVLSWAGP